MEKDIKLVDVIEAGKIMDLSLIESVNDFILHAPNYLPFDKINEVIESIRNQAKLVGIEFCECGFAKNNGVCSMCQKT